jgi:2,3-bisphosphoglycerate-independent phosphoglycerate mutase
LKQSNELLENSFSSFENILKLENTDSLLLSKTNLNENSVKVRKSKKHNQNEEFLEKLIKELIKEKPVWLKKSIINRIKQNGGNVDSNYILKVDIYFLRTSCLN